MSKKIKEYFKGKNPFLLASAAIVIVSVCIISMILKDEVSTTKENDMVSSTKQSTEESIADTESVKESFEAESSEATGELQESETIETSVEEDEEATKVVESEPVNIAETQSKPDESVQSTPVPEKKPVQEIESTQENRTEPEVTVTPEADPDPKPEPPATPEPEVVPSEEPSVPEEIPVPQPTPAPEVTPAPEITPSPEETPVIHEHSWIFDSWYQEPTCSNGGLVIEICGHCGETQVTGGTPTGEHSYTVEAPGDCCSQEVVVCTECNYREIREKDPGNHIDVEDGFCYGCGRKTD